MKKITTAIAVLGIALALMPNSVRADLNVKEQNIVLNTGATSTEASVNLVYDAPTNLLVDSAGDSLEVIQHAGKSYELKSVDITRLRQKVEIEYYEGDYNTSRLVGIDSGYVDYDDYVRGYIMSVDAVNEAFNASIPSHYKMVLLNSVPSYLPEIVNPEEPVKVKVLIAEVLKFTVSAYKYQNRQDRQNIDPIGMLKEDVDTNENFWQVNSLGTSFSGIRGQEVSIKSVGQFSDSYTASSRVGSLQHFGLYDEVNGFMKSDTIVISDSLPSKILMAGFYEVEDYDQPLKKPGTSSSVTSGANVGFVGQNNAWKSPSVSETYIVQDSVSLLSAYPLHLDEDPFTNPEYELYYPPENWALGSPLSFVYTYELIPATRYTVTFESNGGTDVAPLTDIEAGSLISLPTAPTREGYTFSGWYVDVAIQTEWNFDTDVVSSDMTLYAKWTADQVDPKPPVLPEIPSNPGSPELPATGLDATTNQAALAMIAAGSALLVIRILKKRKS